MPKIFTTLDKIKPAYDITYKVVLFICKLLLIADILITTMSVIGRYVPFIPDPAWTEEVVLTCMSYMAVLSAALAIRRGAHIRMTAFDVYLPKIVVKVLDILADLAVCILGVIMMVVGWNYATTLGGRGPALSQLPGRVEQVGRADAAGQRPAAAPKEERRGGAGGEAEAADIHAGVGQSVCNAVPEGIFPQLAQKGSSAAQRRIGQRQRGGTAAHPGPERLRRRERGRAFQLEPRLAETI